MMLFILLVFRGNMDKEDNTEDKLDGLQKQVVSHMDTILSVEKHPRLGSGLGAPDCSAEIALHFAQHFSLKIINLNTALHFYSRESFDFDITIDFRCIIRYNTE